MQQLPELGLGQRHEHGDLVGRALVVVDAEGVHGHAADAQLQAPLQRVQQLPPYHLSARQHANKLCVHALRWGFPSALILACPSPESVLRHLEALWSRAGDGAFV